MGTRAKVLVAAVAAVVAVAGAGAWWFLRDDAPPEVSLEAAVGSVGAEEDRGGADAAADGSAAGDDAGDDAPPPAGIEGTWVVDAESGSFDFDSATGTFVGYRINENLSTIGSTQAVGRTGDVTGSITIEGTTLTAATFEADLRTLTSNQSRRDGRVQDALATDRFPTAAFVLTEPVDLGADPGSGQPVAVTATGDLTLHGVTRSVEVALEGVLVDQTVVVVGSLPVTFADHDVEVPSAPIVLSVDDHGTLELQLLLTRA